MVRGCECQATAPRAGARLAHVPESDYASTLRGDSFDLILIDGIRRDECAAVARELIRPGGMIVVDNSNRPECATFIPSLGDIVGVFTGHATQTTIIRACR